MIHGLIRGASGPASPPRFPFRASPHNMVRQQRGDAPMIRGGPYRVTTLKRRGPAHSALAREIGVAIVTGRIPTGSTLPGEVEIAEQRGISRSVVREALRMLAAKGLVVSKPKAGTRVRERLEWNLLDPELLAWMFEGEPPAGFVTSLFQLRLIVEPAAAELAAVKRDTRQLSRMGAALEAMGEHGLHTEQAAPPTSCSTTSSWRRRPTNCSSACRAVSARPSAGPRSTSIAAPNSPATPCPNTATCSPPSRRPTPPPRVPRPSCWSNRPERIPNAHWRADPLPLYATVPVTSPPRRGSAILACQAMAARPARLRISCNAATSA